ncbi:spermidine/putrescine import ATP-binding protein PotA [Rhodobacteraceae bacterium KLH11]|nr:spermidine/putrescine import ATP-binding protein PotA [Rhodobacteraceae bacterium KLH11]
MENGNGVCAVDIQAVEKVYHSKGRQPVQALKKVSLSIRDNEFFTLLGPSGCGKTTLLRLIAGFEQPTAGEILLFGNRIEGLTPYSRSVNTVFQHYSLFPHMTVADNIGFGLKMLKIDQATRDKTVSEMLSLVHMEDFANRMPHQLSGGQQQRIALARALAPHPKVLLLDEPLSALDLKLRQAMRLELKQLQEKTGITFVFVTHDQEEALAMSDRIAVMSNGEVQQIGTAGDIYDRPSNSFVADFIGETNLIDAEITSQAGAISNCDFPGGTLQAETITGRSVSDKVTLTLRPEKLRLSTAEEPEQGRMMGHVVERVFLGTDTTYLVQISPEVTLQVREQNALPGATRFDVGAKVSVAAADGATRILEG